MSGSPRESLGVAWIPWESLGVPGQSLGVAGSVWESEGSHSLGLPRKSWDSLGTPWNPWDDRDSQGFAGTPGNSQGLHGLPKGTRRPSKHLLAFFQPFFGLLGGISLLLGAGRCWDWWEKAVASTCLFLWRNLCNLNEKYSVPFQAIT